jgi:integrase
LEALPRAIDGRVFPLTPNAVKQAWDRARARAGLSDLHLHDLRHEAACRWFEHRTGAGWTFSDVEVARIMGWASLAMALRYASMRGEDLAARLG